MDSFENSTRESDDARIALERECLLFERKSLEQEIQEQQKERLMRAERLEKDRVMQKEECKAHERIELEDSS